MPIQSGQGDWPKLFLTMSKGNMLLGHARGKVGDLVFSRVNGQQVTRARASVVKNPQTEAQMIQRILLNTIIQAYSRMSEICDHSFEGIPVGQKSMSQFMKRNLSLLRERVAAERAEGKFFEEIFAFSPIGLNNFTMNAYVLSSGSLPQVDAECDSFVGGKVAITMAGASLTYADVINTLGLQRGDQLTFVCQEAYTDSRASFKFARVILDPRDADGNALDLSTLFLNGTAINMPSPRNEGEEMAFSYANGNLQFMCSSGSTFGAAVIVSRQKADGTWLRSNAQITLDAAMPWGLIRAYSMQDALDMAASGALDLQSERYLNNAARRITAGGAADTITVKKMSPGSPIPNDIDSLEEVEIVGIIEGTDGSTTVILAYDAEGNEYVVYNQSTYTSAYGKLLQSKSGDTSSAWVATPKTENNLATEHDLIFLFPESNWEDPICANTLWFSRQGVDLGVFVNP